MISVDITFSSVSGTLDKKSSTSLFAIAFGFRSFFVNLLIPHAITRYRNGR